MSKSKIQWTERTWNPVTGCTKHSEGCRNCYAETMSRRLQGMGQERYRNGFMPSIHPEALDEPIKIRKPSMFFVCSMGDLFHKAVSFDFIDKVMEVIDHTKDRHTYQILTKRTERMVEYFRKHEVPFNSWIGTTVESPDVKHRIKTLTSLNFTGVVKFLSCEPLLGDLGELNLAGIDWVIVGGESGPHARPMRKEWVLNIQRQCREQGVPFFFKQWGTWGEDGVKRNKKANGNTIDGVVYQQWPMIWKGGM